MIEKVLLDLSFLYNYLCMLLFVFLHGDISIIDISLHIIIICFIILIWRAFTTGMLHSVVSFATTTTAFVKIFLSTGSMAYAQALKSNFLYIINRVIVICFSFIRFIVYCYVPLSAIGLTFFPFEKDTSPRVFKSCPRF